VKPERLEKPIGMESYMEIVFQLFGMLLLICLVSFPIELIYSKANCSRRLTATKVESITM